MARGFKAELKVIDEFRDMSAALHAFCSKHGIADDSRLGRTLRISADILYERAEADASTLRKTRHE